MRIPQRGSIPRSLPVEQSSLLCPTSTPTSNNIIETSIDSKPSSPYSNKSDSKKCRSYKDGHANSVHPTNLGTLKKATSTSHSSTKAESDTNNLHSQNDNLCRSFSKISISLKDDKVKLEKKIELNIPLQNYVTNDCEEIDGEESDKSIDNQEEDSEEQLVDTDDEFIEEFEGLEINSSKKDNDTDNTPALVAKCPEKREKIIAENRINACPYSQATASFTSRNFYSGGECVAIRQSVSNIPVPQSEFQQSSSANDSPDDAVGLFMSCLGQKERETLYKTIDQDQALMKFWINSSEPEEFLNKTQSLASPDSGTGTVESWSSYSDSPRPSACSESPRSEYSICSPPSFSSYTPIRQDSVHIDENGMDLTGIERMQKKMSDSKKLVEQWKIICQMSDDEFCSINNQGQTILMEVLLDKKNEAYHEKVLAIVSRIAKSKKPDLLLHKDSKRRSALYIAACITEDHLVARFITDTIMSLGRIPDECFDNMDNGLLHVLARYGDSHAHVLAELLHAQGLAKERAFKVNSKNFRQQTPLHIAAETHSELRRMIATTKLLIKFGASVTETDKEQQTPLHVLVQKSCDPCLITVMLKQLTPPLQVQAVNAVDDDYRTPLHLAALRNDLKEQEQKEVILKLMHFGASNNLRDSSGNIPLKYINKLNLKKELKELKAGYSKKHM